MEFIRTTRTHAALLSDSVLFVLFSLFQEREQGTYTVNRFVELTGEVVALEIHKV
jgi:hypothetical protein